jgi:hypothetical protein
MPVEVNTLGYIPNSFFFDISVLVGGWIDQSLHTSGRWLHRSVAYGHPSGGPWCAGAEFERTAPTDGSRSGGFALFFNLNDITVDLNK